MSENTTQKQEKKSLKEKLFETVNPVLAYSIFGGAVALAVAIGVIVCLVI